VLIQKTKNKPIRILTSYLIENMNKDIPNEKGLALGISIILILIILGCSPLFFGFELGPIKNGPSSILTGIYLQLWGVLFLLSYYFSHKTFFFRALMWVCENFSSPRGRKMAFFYFALSFLLGTVALLRGLTGNEHKEKMQLPPGIEPIENWWYKDPTLYIVLFFIIALGYYRYHMNKSKRK
jgi:hypothetical protein